MTAHELIASIFARVQSGLPSNERYLTPMQFDYLKDLIGADPEGSAVANGMNGGFTWMPSGRSKYVLSYDPVRNRRKLTRLQTLEPTESGRLFT